MAQLIDLNNYYQVHVNHLLSTRVDSDVSEEFFSKVIFHGTAYNSLKTIVESFALSNQSTFTLTGSYGTGKSTLAAILTGLLHQNNGIRNAVRRLINDEELLSKIDSAFKVDAAKPWLVVRAVGGITTPVELIHKSFLAALKSSAVSVTSPEGLALLQRDVNSEDQLLVWIEELYKILDGRISGSLFILDEMGKLLDHITRSNGDLHFFQDLSERINRISTRETPLIFLGILHQAFSDYAKGLSHQIALEWAKIQGRYVDISYRISVDETIALVSKAIKRTESELPDSIKELNNSLIDGVALSINAQLVRSSPQIKRYFLDALPLHPLTTIIIGAVAKSSFSQNERSIFSFLLSVEPFSFREFLSNKIDSYRTYTVVDLWNYLSQNLQHQILSSKEGHAWSTVEEALNLLDRQLDKLNYSREEEQFQCYFDIVKIISMVNLFGKTLGIYSTQALIANSLQVAGVVSPHLDTCLKNLMQWGLVSYWNKTDSYEVVASSEYNIQQLLQEKIQTLSTHQSYFDYIDYKGGAVLAKRHYQQKGIMRWMEQHLVEDVVSLKRLVDSEVIKTSKAFSHFILFTNSALGSGNLSEISHQYPELVIAQLKNRNEILTWSKEIFALKEIAKELPNLMRDNVAKKEYDQRLNYAYQQVDVLFRQSFEGAEWYRAGGQIMSDSLSMVASDVADKVFDACPAILNELVVRHNVSSSAAAGRKKLLEKMLESPEQEHLGIDKFPPEKAIYLSCLKRLGLHQYQGEQGKWCFQIPEPSSCRDPAEVENLELVANMFKKGYEFITSRKELVTLEQVYNVWEAAPYGIPQGLQPIFGLALLLAKEDALAFYDKDVTQEFRFISAMDEEFLNKLVKRPHEVAVKFIKEPDEKNRLVQLLAQSIQDIFSKDIEVTPLAVARFLVSYIVKQSNWVKFSRDTDFFDTHTQLLRARIVKADDPYKLLFDDLYELLDVEGKEDKQILAGIADFFITILNAKSALLKKFEESLYKELGVITPNLLQQASLISQSAADWQMKKFAEHLSNSSNEPSQWLINIITLMGQVPERDWSDDSLKKAFEVLPSYIQRFKQLSFFAKNALDNQPSTDEHHSLAIIVNTPGGFEEYNREVVIEQNLQADIHAVQAELDKHFETLKLSDDAKAVALYQLLKKYLHLVGEEKHES